MKSLPSIIRIAVVTAVVAGTAIHATSHASAQSGELTTGVVTTVEVDAGGRLEAFSVIDGDGDTTRFSVSPQSPNTQFGLENRVGDRWVSDQASDALEAANRLRDQQARLVQITVQADSDGVAMSVVQAESKDVATNLGYLLAVVAIVWIGFMGYLAFLGVRQHTLSAELNRLDDNDG